MKELYFNTLILCIAGINIKTILMYYAVLCLALTPLTFLLLIYLSRRTNLLERIDAYIDKKLPPEKGNKPDAGKDEASKPAAEKINQSQVQAQSGISAFEIKVGETYQCHLNYHNRGGSYGGMLWLNDNDFIGTINEYGLFKSNKAGTANIFCAYKGYEAENSAQAYAITVLPSEPDWFVDKYIERVKKRTPKIDFLAWHAKRRITSEKPAKEIITYAGNTKENSQSLSVQFDETGSLIRILFCLSNKERKPERIIRNLNERFDEVKLEDESNIRIWVHQIIDHQHNEVDVYAFLMDVDKDQVYLGIGQTWREYGEREEFEDNIKMALRTFRDILPNNEINDIKAVKITEENGDGTGDNDNDENSTEDNDTNTDEVKDKVEKETKEIDGFADFHEGENE